MIYTRQELATIAVSPMAFMDLSFIERRNMLLSWIQTFPEKHNQSVWGEAIVKEFTGVKDNMACGTAACLAGWAGTFAGAYPVFMDYTWLGGSYQKIIITGENEDRYNFTQQWESMLIPGTSPEDTEIISTDGYATEILGITRGEADTLFDEGNTLEDIEYFIGRLNAGDGIDIEDRPSYIDADDYDEEEDRAYDSEGNR